MSRSRLVAYWVTTGLDVVGAAAEPAQAAGLRSRL
jgi:hypothetical protein